MNVRNRILLSLPFLLSVSLTAQVSRTSLNGTVTDEQGKRIPSAKVKATNVATGVRRETETGSQGAYSLPDLETGTFTVEIAKEGFASLRFRSVKLEVGQPRTLDVVLGVAERKEQISVTEAEFQLDRVDATVGAPIEQKQVDELPINGRNWSTLTALVPGAVDTGAGDQRTIRFAGHGLDDNNLTLDGVDATAVFNQMQREYVRLTPQNYVSWNNTVPNVAPYFTYNKVSLISGVKHNFVYEFCSCSTPATCQHTTPPDHLQ